MPPNSAAAPARPALVVACLCADWCATCRDYRPLFEALAEAGRAAGRYAWIDIEDHADVLGELDIETFPTLLIGDEAGRLLFFGSVTPHARTLERLVESARAGDLKGLDDVDAIALAARVRAFAAAPGG